MLLLKLSMDNIFGVKAHIWSKRGVLILCVSLVVAALAGTGAYAALGGAIRSPSTGDIDLQSGLMG